MDKDLLFQFFSTQPVSVLLEVLGAAYDQLDRAQRQAVFGTHIQKLPPPTVDGDELLSDIEKFRDDSLAGHYYVPFNINSKNYMHVPEETEEWFERLGELLAASERLTWQGDHLHAVVCFGILYELIGALEYGKEIVFGDEIGSWMIPGEEKKFIVAYLKSLAAISTPETFTAGAVPLIKRDSGHSFADQVYVSSIDVANPEQKAHVEAELQRLKIRTGRAV
jgi:hypothetical protein